jgi:hydrogenase/urease accessory protein HupE
MRRVIALSIACFGLAVPAHSHPVPFSYLDVHIQDRAVEMTVVVHTFDVAHDLDLQPPERLLEPGILSAQGHAIVALVKSRLQLQSNGHSLGEGVWSQPVALMERQSLEIRARFDIATAPGTVQLRTLMFPYDPVHQSFINFYERGAIATQAILDKDRTAVQFYASSPRGVWSVAREFVPAGARHILTGLDHLIFLFGLLLLGGTMRHLVLIVSAFTVAQILTLALAALNIVTPSLRFVEPGIALSIIYVGADNLMVRGGRDVRVWIAAVFGFIHGFGYAGVLRGLNLSRLATSWSVLSFNLGVEIAQLVVVFAVALALEALRSRSEVAGRRLAFAGSILVIATGTVWFIQRVFFPGGMA